MQINDTRRMRSALLTLLVPLLAACTPADGAPPAGSRSRAAEAEPRPGVVIDSAIPIPQAVRRFQAATEEPAPERLTEGAATLEELLARLVRAYVARDAGELHRLAMTRAEFGYLYYPESVYPDPPYQLAPDFLWFLIEQNGAQTVARAVERLAGSEARMVEYSCPAGAKREGQTEVWGPCFVTVEYAGGGSDQLRLVNAIARRDGRFKVISFDGKL
jgi:hypothetical protein